MNVRRKLPLLALIVLVLAAIAPAPALAYHAEGSTWPGHPAKIRYYVATPSVYAFSIAQGAAAWNTSGARVRFVRVSSKSKAQVVIRQKQLQAGINGYASIGKQRVNYVWLDRCSPNCGDRFYMASIVAHEFGHVIGLGHETRKCATMEPLVWTHCPDVNPPHGWMWQCRLLMKDDIAGAVHRYGGRVKVRSNRWCPKEAAPPAVKAPAADPLVSTPVRVARVSWLVPSARVHDTVIMRRAGTCPTSMFDLAATEVRGHGGKAGTRVGVYDDLQSPPPLLTAGSHCYRIWSIGEFGRPGGSITVMLAYPGPPAVPAPTNIAVVDQSTQQNGADVKVTVTAPNLSWLRRAEVLRRVAPDCPTSIDDPTAEYAGVADLVAGSGTIHDNTVSEHTYCYAAFLDDFFDRSSAPTTTTFNYTPPHATGMTSFTAVDGPFGGEADLAWTWPNDPNVGSAELYRRAANTCPTSRGGWAFEEQINSFDTNWTSYQDTPVDAGTYCYAIYTNDINGLYSAGDTAVVTVS